MLCRITSCGCTASTLFVAGFIHLYSVAKSVSGINNNDVQARLWWGRFEDHCTIFSTYGWGPHLCTWFCWYSFLLVTYFFKNLCFSYYREYEYMYLIGVFVWCNKYVQFHVLSTLLQFLRFAHQIHTIFIRVSYREFHIHVCSVDHSTCSFTCNCM